MHAFGSNTPVECSLDDSFDIEKLKKVAVKHNIIPGLEQETDEKQRKYANYFDISEDQEIRFAGVFKFVETGKFDEHGNKVYKRKRVFRKLTKIKK